MRSKEVEEAIADLKLEIENEKEELPYSEECLKNKETLLSYIETLEQLPNKIRDYKQKFEKDSKTEKVFMTQSSQINASLISFCDELLGEEINMSRKFEYVKRIEEPEFNLPARKTAKSAGYDFECIETITIPPYKKGDKPILVPTGVKCKMPDDEFLMLVNRSSNPKKKNLVIPNSMGIIDADYYGNPDNDGEMMFAFYNLGEEPVTIEKGYAIGQGIFQKYYKTDDDAAEGERLGGFGSTSK